MYDKLKISDLNYVKQCLKTRKKYYEEELDEFFNLVIKKAFRAYDLGIIENLISDPEIDSTYKNKLLIHSINESNLKFVEKLLLDPNVDPTFQHNKAIIKAAENTNNDNKDILGLLLLHPKIDPSAQNNIAIKSAIKFDNKDIVELLLNHPKVMSKMNKNFLNKLFITATTYNEEEMAKLLMNNIKITPNEKDNYNICISISYNNIETTKLLLRKKEVNPNIFNSIAIFNAIDNNYLEMVKLLLKDRRVDPSAQDNEGLFIAIKNDNLEMVKILLQDQRVVPSAQDNEGLFIAIKNNNLEIVKLLLKDHRVDPSARDNEGLFIAIKKNNSEMVKLLLQDQRVDPYIENINNFYTVDDIIIKILIQDYRVDPFIYNNNKNFKIQKFYNERKNIDSYFGLIVDDESYKNKPVELLKYILANKIIFKPRIVHMINYVFMCLDEDNFNKVINSDITDEDMKYILSCVKKIRYEIVTKRELFTIFGNLIDYDFLTNKVLQHEYLLPLLTTIDTGIENSQKIYQKYDFNLPLSREYNIIDIIVRQDTSKLYQYVIKGNYLPYKQHSMSIMSLKLNDKEKQFNDTFMFPIIYHDYYINNLDRISRHFIHSYIYDKGKLCGYNLCTKLRNKELLTSLEEQYYNSLIMSTINAPVINKRCILYRGVHIDDFIKDIDLNGDIFTWKSFSSCSSIREISDAYRRNAACCLFVIIVPENSVLLDITTIKSSEYEILLPSQSIFKYLGTINGCMIIKYLGYKTKYGPYYFESEEERGKTLKEEMMRYE